MAKFLGLYDSNTEEWLKLREGTIGGSQVGAVLGLSPWESPFTCYLKLRGEIPSAVPENDAMRLGTLMEAPLIEMFKYKHPEFDVDANCGTWAHDDYAFFTANPDAILTDMQGRKGILEIKTSSSFWSEPPAHYMAQVNWYLWIMGFDYAYIAGYVGGRWYESKRIERDDFAIDIMVDAVLKFYVNTENGVRPEFDGSESTYMSMRSLNSDVEDAEVELGDLGADLMYASEMFNKAQTRFNQVRSMVLDKLGEAKTGLFNGDKICYRQKASNGVPFLKLKG